MDINPDATRQGESIDDCELSRSERNRYFHGKLMSARDMEAEQRYYRELFTRHAREVTGQGVVSGLDVTVEPSGDDFEVTLTPGYAVDCCGRPVVVPNETTRTVEPEDEVDDGGPAWLFLEYVECVRESVPVPNSEDACEQQCEYNRILEVFDVRIERPDPDRSPTKPVPPTEFPSKDDVEADEAAALDTIAREYDPGDVPVGCSGEGHSVFLGQYADGADGWVRDDEDYLRSRAYPNDMLYAGLARHAADFENPHQVSLRAEEASDGALLGNEHDDTDEADVTLASLDATLSIEVSDQRVELEMGEAIEELVEKRLAPVERHVMNRTLRYTHQAFSRGIYRDRPTRERLFTYSNGLQESVLHQRDDDEAIFGIREITKEMLLDRVEDPPDPLETFDAVFDAEQSFTDTIEEMHGDGLVTDESYERLESAMDELEDAFEAEDVDLMEVAVAQDRFCQAAVLLEPAGAYFEVSDLDPVDVEVEPGEEFDASATVENTGNSDGTEDVELRIDGTVVDEQELELGAGESSRITFEAVDTGGLSAGTYEYKIASGDDGASGQLTVTGPSEEVDPVVDFDLESQREKEQSTLFRDPTEGQAVSGDTNLDQGDEIALVLKDDQGGTELERVTTTVDEANRFKATFDFSGWNHDEYFLVVTHEDATAGTVPLVVDLTAEFLYRDVDDESESLLRRPPNNVTVGGETNLLEGEEVTVRLASQDETARPMLLTETVETDSTGAFLAEFSELDVSLEELPITLDVVVTYQGETILQGELLLTEKLMQ